MRSTAILVVVAALALPLVATAQTNEWELQGDLALKTHPELAVKAYAKALLTDGTTVMSLQTDEEQEPYIVAMERVLDKVPWGSADTREFVRLMLALKPVLTKDFTGAERKERVKELVGKYRLVKDADEAEDFAGMDSYDVSAVSIHVIEVDAFRVVAITADMTDLDIAQLPVNTLAVISVGSADAGGWVDLGDWVAVYDLAFNIMGDSGLYVPYPNSPLGLTYRELEKRLTAYGPDWKASPDLVADWTAYWTDVKAALSRRERFRSRRIR